MSATGSVPVTQALYGGVQISRADDQVGGRQVLAAGRYDYQFYRTDFREQVSIGDLGSFSLYVLRCPASASVRLSHSIAKLEQGDVVQAEASSVSISVEGGPVDF